MYNSLTMISKGLDECVLNICDIFEQTIFE